LSSSREILGVASSHRPSFPEKKKLRISTQNSNFCRYFGITSLFNSSQNIKPSQIRTSDALELATMVLKQLFQRPNESDKDFEKRKDKQIKDAAWRKRQKAEKEKQEKSEAERQQRLKEHEKKRKKENEQARVRNKRCKKKEALEKEKKMQAEIKALREELQDANRKISVLENYQAKATADIFRFKEDQKKKESHKCRCCE